MSKDGFLPEMDYLGIEFCKVMLIEADFLLYFLCLTLILQGQEKYGLLNVTKITENGKKVR